MIYLLDSNTISDYIAGLPETVNQVNQLNAAGETLGLCRPVYYEIQRGLLWRDAAVKMQRFQRIIGLILIWVELEASDWDQAAQFYAAMRRTGKQLADSDLFLAALTFRLKAILVSNDRDFDALPLNRISWRS